MSANPLFIDNLNFAKKREHLSGSLALADCPRLEELLQSHSPTAGEEDMAQDVINFSLDGEVNALGQPFLHLFINASLTTYCQRCLEKMPLDLGLRFDYLVSDAEGADAEMLEDNDDYDMQEVSQAMDLKALVEDEVIMALPIAPMHEDGCAHGAMESGERPNPFAVLKGLIKS